MCKTVDSVQSTFLTDADTLYRLGCLAAVRCRVTTMAWRGGQPSLSLQAALQVCPSPALPLHRVTQIEGAHAVVERTQFPG